MTELGISKACVECYAISGEYGAKSCKADCLLGWCKAGCLSCTALAQKDLATCTGFPTPTARPSNPCPSNKFDYKMGDISNVSIVDYENHVAKEDREPMTPSVCFEFCRTVPEMLFFGLNMGRDCYCTPYFKPVAGDSSNCDAVCEGDPTLMCGGDMKSSVFSIRISSSPLSFCLISPNS